MPCNKYSDTRSNDNAPELGSDMISGTCYKSGDGLTLLKVVLLRRQKSMLPRRYIRAQRRASQVGEESVPSPTVLHKRSALEPEVTWPLGSLISGRTVGPGN